MKKCKYCQITVETDKNFCPICFNRLEKIDDNSEQFYSLRTENDTTVKTSAFLKKLFIFTSVCAFIICLIINLITYPKVQWFWVVGFGLLYIWVLIAHTIMSHRSVLRKILLQIVTLLPLLYFTEKLSLSDWLLPYVYPSMSLCALYALLMLIFVSKRRSEYLLGFIFIIVLLAVGSIMCLIFMPVDYFRLLHFINLVCLVMVLFGLFLFGFQEIKSEAQRKWHI